MGLCPGRPRPALSSGSLSSRPGANLSKAGVARGSSRQCWDPVRGARLGKLPPVSPGRGLCPAAWALASAAHTPPTVGGGSGLAFLRVGCRGAGRGFCPTPVCEFGGSEARNPRPRQVRRARGARDSLVPRPQRANPQGPTSGSRELSDVGAALPVRLGGGGPCARSRCGSPGDPGDSPAQVGFPSEWRWPGSQADKSGGAAGRGPSGVRFLPGDRGPLLAGSPSAVPRDPRGLRGPQHPSRAGRAVGPPKDEPVGPIWLASGLGTR